MNLNGLISVAGAVTMLAAPTLFDPPDLSPYMTIDEAEAERAENESWRRLVEYLPVLCADVVTGDNIVRLQSENIMPEFCRARAGGGR